MINGAANSQFVDPNDHLRSFAGSQDRAISSADFQTVIAARQTGGQRADANTFLSLIQGADDPQSKRAAIEGFAAGYANAKSGDTPLRFQPMFGDVATSAQTANGGAAQTPAGVMNGYATLAGQIADSNLPTTIKDGMLDDIAARMATLYNQNPPPASSQGNATGASTNGSRSISPSDTMASVEQKLLGQGISPYSPSDTAFPEAVSRQLGIANGGSDGSSTGSGYGSSSDTMAAVEQKLRDKGISPYSPSETALPDNILEELRKAEGSSGGTSGDSSDVDEQKDKVWTHENKDGVATIHLGDEYTLRIGEKDQSITLTNNFTHAATRIWGDPHIDIGNDGKNEFDFHDGMTLKLDNGIELRLGTMSNGGDVTYTTNLTILQGDRAIQVSGIAGDMDGKDNLTIVQSDEGRALAHLTPKGAFVLREAGDGWETKEHQAITQDYINEAEALYHGTKRIMN